MLSRNSIGLAILACALTGGQGAAQPPGGAKPSSTASADPEPRLGDPYLIDGKSYRPVDAPLDEVGYAGALVAKPGQAAISAAHRTLPIPSYVEVTALDSGRTILVLIGERGPFANDRVIDLSCKAMQQLGLGSRLPAAVRVRRVQPVEQERAALRSDHVVAERIASPAGLLEALRRKLPSTPAKIDAAASDCGTTAPPVAVEAAVAPTPVKGDTPPPARNTQPTSAPAPAQAPRNADDPFIVEQAVSPASRPPEAEKAVRAIPVNGNFAIQGAAISDRVKAGALARSIGGYVERAGPLYRIRKGPYPTETAARNALPQMRAKGFADAKVVTIGKR